MLELFHSDWAGSLNTAGHGFTKCHRSIVRFGSTVMSICHLFKHLMMASKARQLGWASFQSLEERERVAKLLDPAL